MKYWTDEKECRFCYNSYKLKKTLSTMHIVNFYKKKYNPLITLHIN